MFASTAAGLNFDGSIVGGTIYGNIPGIGNTRQAVQWVNGSMQTLAIEPWVHASEARAVSLSGDRIVGNVSDILVPEQATSTRSKAAIWINGACRVLENTSPDMYSSFTAISDDGGKCLAAISTTRSNSKGGRIYDVNTNTSADLVSDYNGDGSIDFFDYDAFVVALNSLSSDGAVIGGSVAPIGGAETATLWLRQGKFGLNYTNIDALAYLSSLGVTGLTGWNLTSVTAVSADGLTLSGSGINPAGFNDIWVATVPTPGSLTLAGLGTLLTLRRRRSH
jgi:MYXO-CTERM domain-containing protein